MATRTTSTSIPLAFCLLLAAPSCSDQHQREHSSSTEAPADNRPTFPKAGQYERYLALLDENGKITPDGLMKAKKQRDELLMQPLSGGGVSPGTWRWHGPSNIGGRMRALYIHPTSPNIMVLGSASGGIWRTKDGGTTWRVVDDWMPSLAISSIVAHPSAPATLYAGTGEIFAGDGIPGAGIFKSFDLGKTWTRLASTNRNEFQYVNELAISPGNPRVLLAATTEGIWRSTNAGSSWTRVHSGLALDVHFDPTGTSAIANVETAGDIAAFSRDGGVTWSTSTGLPRSTRIRSFGRTEFVFSSDPNVVHAGVAAGLFSGVYVSRDRGASFRLRSLNNPYGPQGTYNNTIWVEPASNGRRVLLGGVDLHASNNGGGAWAKIVGAHVDFHVVTPHPQYNATSRQTVFVGSDGGLYRIDDAFSATPTVTSLNEGLGTSQFYGGAITADGLPLGGMQDRGTAMLRNSVGTRWTTLQGFDGIHAAADPVDRKVYYGTSQYSGVFRVLDGGTTVDRFDPPNSGASNGAPFMTRILLDPNHSSRLFCGTKELMVCDDTKTSGTPTWRQLTRVNRPVTAFAVAHGASNIAYHNTGQRFFRTVRATDPSPRWFEVSNPRLGRMITEIVACPHETWTVYVCMGGYAADNLLRSTDGGRTWTALPGTTSRLPEAPIHALAIHPRAPDWLYVGTEVGLFVSQDGGATWTASNEGPSNAVIDHLVFKGDKLWAFTHGRGVYSAHASTPEDADIVIRASVSSIEAEGNADSASASIDAQGRRVAFDSEASNLVVSDSNGIRDVFVRDLQSGTTEIVSGRLPGPRANGASTKPCIAHEGRFVAFQSKASNLVPNDSNGLEDIFVYDLQDQRTERIPPRGGQTQAAGNSRSASITPAGRYVVFTSEAPNLVVGDTNGVADVFRYDRATEELIRVSIAGQTLQANAISENSSRAVSANGKLIAFASRATNLVSKDTNARRDIFVRDIANRITTRVSISSGGGQGNGDSGAASISADGRYVVFDSAADNLVPNDSNDHRDIFVHDRQAKTTRRVSLAASGAEANGPSFGGMISPDGAFVVFYSAATNLVGGDTNNRIDVFIRDLASSTTKRVSINAAGFQANGSSALPDVASLAANIAFQSIASNLVPNDLNGAEDVFTTTARPGLVVWPTSRAIQDGIGHASRHFAGLSRSQHVYRAGSGAQLQVSGLRFRRDAHQAGGGAQARRIVLEVDCGAANIDEMNGDFARTFVKAPIRVFSRKPISLPDLRAVPQSLPGFRVRIPFDRPYAHDGANDLGFELRVFSTTSQGDYPIDVHGEIKSVHATTVVVGTGCQTQNGVFSFDASYVSNGPNSELGLRAQGAIANSALFLMLGTRDPNLSLKGLCANMRTIARRTLLVGRSDAKGNLTTRIRVAPWSPSLIGAKWTAQMLAFDFRQQIPFSLSNGLLIKFPNDRPGPSARSVFAPETFANKGALLDRAFTLALESK